MNDNQYFFFEFKKQRQKQLLVYGGLVLMFLILSIFFIFQIEDLSQKINDIKIQTLATQQALDVFSTLTNEQQQAQKYLERLTKIFPNKDSLINLATIIRDKSLTYNLSENFSFGSEFQGQEEEIKNVGFNLALSGSLDNFLRFLQDIEKLPFFIEFSAIDVNNVSNSNYQINTAGKIYTR
ncbi:MAG TPA: type 4a pilus biogenesis protein PilO [Candidatus Paceibacterota bacterium]|jgi:Tfp pilus assembly protein PilO|nr:type 4a pilus biogenesis protein PilO [Candidatus Paceibacterota bacterium]